MGRTIEEMITQERKLALYNRGQIIPSDDADTIRRNQAYLTIANEHEEIIAALEELRALRLQIAIDKHNAIHNSIKAN